MYPTAPVHVWEDCTDGEITLHWNYENNEIELFCQAEVIQPDGKVELVWNLNFLNKNIVRVIQKNNSPAIQIHCKSYVGVSVFWICLLPKLYTHYVVHLSRFLTLFPLFHKWWDWWILCLFTVTSVALFLEGSFPLAH